MSGTEPTVAGRIRQMQRPGLYGGSVKRVRLIQTHTSWVFLTGEYCYKVKKPVNFGFLDYTTLAARKSFCSEEFKLNKRLSPDIYLAVLPIREHEKELTIGGRGRTIDYCIKMRELPQDSIMTERLKHGKVTFSDVDSIARQIAGFHEHAGRGPRISRYGSLETVRLNWDENFAQTTEFRGRTITGREFDAIRRQVEQFILKKRHLFRRRREAGFVRRCHGDLHSGNIFIGDKVRIFDCIEFNPRFSCSDTASEVAFMAMDLDFHGRHDLASFFIERYVAYTGDYGLLRLLDFYLCYRAYVRGKVTSFNLNDPGIPAQARAKARLTARKYFRLSERYASRLFAKPRLVVTFGLPGAGKTYIARRLASRLGAFHLLSDSIRKQLAGIPVEEHAREAMDRGIYTRSISRRTYAEMTRRARAFLKAGQSVVLDATFLRDDARGKVRELAGRLGIRPLFVFADCPEKTVAARMRRRGREHSLSDADFNVYRNMKSRFVPPGPGKDMVRVDTRQPAGTSLAEIERALLRR